MNQIELIKRSMVALHTELGNFQTYLARKSVPAMWGGEEYEAINYVLQLVEREVAELKQKQNDQKNQ